MTIKKRGSSFKVDVMINGVRHRPHFRTKAEAQQHETFLRSQAAGLTSTKQVAQRSKASKNITIADLCATYVSNIERRYDQGKRMTLDYKEGMKGQIRNWVIGGVPFYQSVHGREVVFEGGLGSLTLAEINEDEARIEEFLDDIASTGVSVKTIRGIRQVLGRVLQPAVKKGYLSYNVATEMNYYAGRGAKLRGAVTPPSPDLVAALVEAAGDFGLYVLFAAVTGLRAGEQRALRWEHIDFDAGLVRVETRVDRRGQDDGLGPKTYASIRDVPLSDDLRAKMLHHQSVSDFSGLDDLVFPSHDGGPLNHDGTVRSRYHRAFKRVLASYPSKAATLARPRWHDLRHFAVSLWIAAEASPKQVQTWAGHKSITTTMDIYGHLFPSEDHHKRMNQAQALIPLRSGYRSLR